MRCPLMRYLLAILVIASAVLLAAPQSVSAASTPEFCEAVKYGCSTVDYSVSGGTATVSNRWYKGSIGGSPPSAGADAWQLY
jgi:hypothetical protein